MWIQAIAIILPRVQNHYSVPDSYIGLVSSSMFGGMMVGAVGWGTCMLRQLLSRYTAKLTDTLNRFGPYGTKYSVQRDTVLYVCLWPPRNICQLVQNPMHSPILPWECRWGELLQHVLRLCERC